MHEPLTAHSLGVPYFEAAQGRDGLWWWAKCPRCGRVVKNKDGYGPFRHWRSMMKREGR